jgi:hypothetical protein
MKSNTKARSWVQAAPDLVNRLRTDWRNAQMLNRPWSRAAHNMVNGWRIRLSRPPAKGSARAASAKTWSEFARRAVGVAASRANYARKSNWHRWAQYKVSAGSRYIPKAMRK